MCPTKLQSESFLPRRIHSEVGSEPFVKILPNQKKFFQIWLYTSLLNLYVKIIYEIFFFNDKHFFFGSLTTRI